MDMLIILMLIIGAIVFIVGWHYLREQEQHTKRFMRFSHDEGKTTPEISNRFYETLITAISSIGQLKLFHPINTPAFKQSILQAGWLNKKAPEIFIGSIVLIDILILFLVLLATSLSPQAANFFAGTTFRLTMSFVLFFYFCEAFPKIFLDRKKKEFIKTMLRQFPDFLDLFLIHIMAGKTNIDALKETLYVTRDIYPQVGQQINFLVGELQTLPSHEIAWQNFSDRVDNPEIRDAIKIIRHCETLGLPLERDLKLQINHIRQNYLAKLEEKITRLPTTLLFPMFLFIFPSLFIIILTPALMKVLLLLK